MDGMYLEKASFITFELNSLVKKIDDRITKLEAIPNSKGDDIVSVAVYYGDCSSFRINVECDSLSAIAMDVIRKIQ